MVHSITGNVYKHHPQGLCYGGGWRLLPKQLPPHMVRAKPESRELMGLDCLCHSLTSGNDHDFLKPQFLYL